MAGCSYSSHPPIALALASALEGKMYLPLTEMGHLFERGLEGSWGVAEVKLIGSWVTVRLEG